MKNDLEGILEFNDYSNINKKGNDIDFTKNFLEDIKEFHKIKVNKEKLPFVNQEKTFKQIARVFSSQYPYVVLVGEPGIGKSMILNYVSDILTGKKTLNDLKKVQPETVPLFKKIINRVNKYERLSYLTLPSLQDPLNVTLVPYNDEEKMYNDHHIAQCFCSEISDSVSEFIEDNPQEIKFTFTEKQMRSFFKDNIHSLYKKINTTANDMIFDKCKEYRSSIISLIDLNLIKKTKEYSIEANWNLNLDNEVEKAVILALKPEAGYKSERINISLKDLEKGLSNTVIPSKFSSNIDRLILDVIQSEISNSELTPNQIFEEEFENYKKQINEIKKNYKSGKIKTQIDLLRILNKKDYSSNTPVMVSDSTLNLINNELEKILNDYTKETNVSKDILSWMNTIVNYFHKNKNIVKNSLNEQYGGIRAFEDNDLEDNDLENKDKKEDKNIEKNHKKDKDFNFTFELKHGKHTMSIYDILKSDYILGDSSTDEGITCNKIGSLDEETLFGSFSDTSEIIPPHLTINSLGNFFKGGILLFQDSFGDFIKTIVTSEKSKNSMKEQFLEYLQTGIMSLVQSNGVTYHIKSPKIILGCCNEDPFQRIESIFIKDEAGLRSRIKTIEVPKITLDSKKSRQGSLEVLYNAIEEFNKDHSSSLKLNDETANLLLNLNINSINGYVDLKYRSFVQSLEDLCAYAISKNKKEITSALIKNKIKETLPLTYFSRIDFEKRYGKYFNMPEKEIGHVCGLSTSGDGPGSLFHVNSQFIPGFENVFGNLKRFRMVDVESEMTDETTFKGYELVKDFVQNILGNSGLKVEEMNSKGNWKLKTHFGGNWSKMGGPSASMATTVSVISALTGDAIYKNRFMTGTIDSMTGECGVIGGTYHKSLIPYRIKEITEKLSGKKEKMYMLYPVVNKSDLERDLLFDPFNVRNNVTFYPIVNFAQAYLLSTCGKEITKETWETSLEQKDEVMKKIYSKIKEKFN